MFVIMREFLAFSGFCYAKESVIMREFNWSTGVCYYTAFYIQVHKEFSDLKA